VRLGSPDTVAGPRAWPGAFMRPAATSLKPASAGTHRHSVIQVLLCIS